MQVLSCWSLQAPVDVSRMVILNGGWVTRTVYVVIELDGEGRETRINGRAPRGTPGFIGYEIFQ